MSISTDGDRSENSAERGSDAVDSNVADNDAADKKPKGILNDFDVAGELPRHGRLVIEASAGTGKTYTLASLAARLLIERTCTPSELVLVTFTRAAAAEIRSRIRDRLVAIEADLAQPDGGIALARAEAANDSVSLFYQAQGNKRPELLAGVRDAIGGFDAITIGTIHSFCQYVLSMAPTDSDADQTMASGDDGVLAEAVSDALVTASLLLEANAQTPRVALPVDTAPLWSDLINIFETEPVSAAELPSASSLASAAAKVIATPNALVVPDLAPEAGSLKARLSVALCMVVAAMVDTRRTRLGLLNYDRLQTEAHRLITTNASVRAVLAARFKAVLIDEFQDTDELQWAIFDQTFVDASNTLMVMVGDPKQAIYGFRGGDIHTYLDATNSDGSAAPQKWSLRTNFRSSPAVIAGLNELFAGGTFGGSIAYVPVRSKLDAQRERHGTADGGTADDGIANRTSGRSEQTFSATSEVQLSAVEIRCLDAGEESQPSVPAARRAVAVDAANTAVDLIQRDGMAPGNICVLVNSHADGRSMLRALRQSRVPAVLARPGLVTQSAAAEQWRRLLAAMSRPADVRQARGAMLGWFGGYTIQGLADAEASDVTDWQLTLQRWADVSSERGAAAMYRAVRSASGFEGDLLGHDSGERDATDVAHIAEILHIRSAGRPVAPQVLLDILDAALLESEDESDELKGRSEGDAASVQIMTMHAAKGLEFPITLVPFLWPDFRSSPTRSYSAEFSDGIGPTRRRRVVDLEGSALRRPFKEDAERRKVEYTAQQLDEKRRLAYVALTRAKERVVVWWVRTKKNAEVSALGPILFGGHKPEGESTGIDPHLAWLQAHRASDLIAVDGFSIDVARRRLKPVSSGVSDDDAAVLLAATIATEPVRSDGRWSFTAITRNLAAHGDESGESGIVGGADEPEVAISLDRLRDVSGRAATAAMIGSDLQPTVGGPPELVFPPGWAGTGFGTFVHALFEHLDFASSDADADIPRVIEELAPQVHIDEMLKSTSDIERFVAGVKRVLHAPLGSDFDVGCLAEIARRDRLDELEFDLELPRRGWVAPFERVAERLRSIFAPPHPLAGWADRLADIGGSLDLGGYLNGSIDLVFRTASPNGATRFHVVDYKTNLLGNRAAGYSLADYGPSGLWMGMADHHYPLQALIYGVALHRYLRWRMPDYDPHVHLGSYGYLFVRGMDAAVGLDGHGVCSWPIDADSVIAVSDLFAGTESIEKAAR